MRIPAILFLLITFLVGSQCLQAQKRTAKSQKPAVTSFPKMRPPKLQTFLDKYRDSVSIPATEAEKIIALPLKIYDDKKTEYAISSYQFLYRKKGVTEDDSTGKVSPVSSISADRFKVSPLPAVWVNIIQQDIKRGEELYFFDIIAKDAQGRVMYAPSLKLMIQ